MASPRRKSSGLSPVRLQTKSIMLPVGAPSSHGVYRCDERRVGYTKRQARFYYRHHRAYIAAQTQTANPHMGGTALY